MNDELPNSVDIEAWRERARTKAKEAGFQKGTPEDDAFRHAYVAAMVSKFQIGDFLTAGLGYVVEVLGAFRNTGYAIAGIFDSEIESDSLGTVEKEAFKDLFNNRKGIAIGNSATDEADIIRQITEQIHSGEIITDPEGSMERYENEFGSVTKDPTIGRMGGSAPIPFVASRESTAGEPFNGGINPQNPQGNFDPSALIRILGGNPGSSPRRNANGQFIFTTIAALAREIHKAERARLEEDLIDIFTGGNGTGGRGGRITTPPFIPGSSSGNPFSNILGGIFDNMIGAAFSRHRSSSSSQESARSRDALAGYSQSQQAALYAQWLQRGNRNA